MLVPCPCSLLACVTKKSGETSTHSQLRCRVFRRLGASGYILERVLARAPVSPRLHPSASSQPNTHTHLPQPPCRADREHPGAARRRQALGAAQGGAVRARAGRAVRQPGGCCAGAGRPLARRAGHSVASRGRCGVPGCAWIDRQGLPLIPGGRCGVPGCAGVERQGLQLNPSAHWAQPGSWLSLAAHSARVPAAPAPLAALQAVQMAKAGLKAIYLSGWQVGACRLHLSACVLQAALARCHMQLPTVKLRAAWPGYRSAPREPASPGRQARPGCGTTPAAAAVHSAY